ncbi:MAG: protein kinase [Nanoarchaeota archaeon]|nr:protein kinase [Nanoarchaeota archaeon]
MSDETLAGLECELSKQERKLLPSFETEDGFLNTTYNDKDDLYNIGHFIKLKEMIGIGAQFMVFRAKVIDKETDYDKILTHMMAHWLIQRDSLEEQLQKKGRSVDKAVKINVNDDLEARVVFEDKEFNFTVGYNAGDIKRQGSSYTNKAQKAIEENYQDVIEYLSQRGIMDRNKKFSKKIIKEIVKGIFKDREIYNRGDCVVRISRRTLENDPRSPRERNVTGALHENHMNTCLYSVAKNRMVYVSELAEGKLEPEEMVQLPMERKFEILQAMARAVNFYENIGVTHRDLKPENILINGQNKVSDMGLAKYSRDELISGLHTFITGEGQVLGTPGFFPREQAIGDKADIRADIYSAVGTFYYILTGNQPNQGGDEIREIMRCLVKDRVFPSVPHFDQFEDYFREAHGIKKKRFLWTNKDEDRVQDYVHDVVTFMAKGLANAKENRWQTAREFLEATKAIVNFEKINVDIEDYYRADAFCNALARPTHFLRKVRHRVEAAALAVGIPAVVITNLMPDAVYGLIQKIF